MSDDNGLSELGTNLMTHPDFVAFVEAVALPSKAAQPNAIRFDGALTGGNFDVVGTFRHHGKEWKVHADTHYRPLELAYAAAQSKQDPFVETPTKRGVCLVLTQQLRGQQKSRAKYLYIYQVNRDSGGC